jgi:hypothetical protein
MKFIEQYNKWIDKFHKGFYPTIILENWISVHKTNKIIGFISKNLYYYFNEIELNKIENFTEKNLPIQYLLYHPKFINKILLKNLENKQLSYTNYNQIDKQNQKIDKQLTKMDKQLNKSLYDYYIYQLIYLGFTEYFNNNKNNLLRNKLYKLISKTNLNKNIVEIRDFIDNIKDTEDKIKLKKLTNQFIIINDKKQFIDVLDNTKFNFDQKELEELKEKSIDQIKTSLLKIALTFTTDGKIDYNKPIDNFITLCDVKRENLYCSNKKIIINKQHLKNIIEIISNDIINPLKWKWIFNPIFIDSVINFLQFIKRPYETIYITYE